MRVVNTKVDEDIEIMEENIEPNIENRKETDEFKSQEKSCITSYNRATNIILQ